MPQQGINFQGFFISRPGVYYDDDVTAAAPNTPPVTPPLIFIGYGYGPQPQVPRTFTNPQDLLNAIRGGPASAFVPFLTSPSPTLAGAQQITFIDCSENTQSTLTLLGSGASGAIVLTSALYGPPSNLISATVTTGSIGGSNGCKITLTDNYSNITAIGDNLGTPFQVAYTGAATGVTAVVNSTNGTFALNGPASASTFLFTIGSGGYTTVSQLVQAINGTGFYVAQVISSTQGELPSASLQTRSTPLSPVSGTALQYSLILSSLLDPIFWVNQFASSIAIAVAASGATNSAAFNPNVLSKTYFTGALGVPPVTNDYATALNNALAIDGWNVFMDSNTPAVQALGAQHTSTASSPPYGKWRRFFTGSILGDSVATTMTNARVLDSYSTNYLYPGIYRTDVNSGVNTLYDGLHAAAAACGIASANQIAQPLTNKPLIANGVEVGLTPSQQATLQNAGVMVVYTPPQGGANGGVPTILSDVTTWQIDNNPENTSSQQVACRFWLAYSVVNALSRYVGTIASPPTETLILQATIKILNALIFTSASSNGVLASWDRKSLILVFDGGTQVAAIQFNATLVSQNRYITVFVPIQQLNITLTAASVPGA